MHYAESRNVSAPIRTPYVQAKYFEGNVDIPVGAALTVERHCISYVLDATIVKFNDNLTIDAGSKFKKAG